MKVELIGVPFTSAARPGGIATAIRVLREAGLVESLSGRGEVRDGGDLELIEGSGVRGPSGLLNERALGRLVTATREAIARSLDRGRLPLFVGGDCPVLLGGLAAGGDDHGNPGLLLVDGHEDAWPPERSDTGEASDSEVAIALGRVAGLPAPLDDLVPLLAPHALVMLGPRDRRELEAASVDSLDGAVALFRDDAAVRASGAAVSARDATATLAVASSSFWLHVDLDVLRSDDFLAADYLQPGGLTWHELLDIAGRARRPMLLRLQCRDLQPRPRPPAHIGRPARALPLRRYRRGERAPGHAG
ncbi:MAG: arginase family protein [Thermoleophilaceae bacterium]